MGLEGLQNPFSGRSQGTLTPAPLHEGRCRAAVSKEMLFEHIGAPLLLHVVRGGHEGCRGSGSEGRRGTGEFWQGFEAENGDAAGGGQGGGRREAPSFCAQPLAEASLVLCWVRGTAEPLRCCMRSSNWGFKASSGDVAAFLIELHKMVSPGFLLGTSRCSQGAQPHPVTCGHKFLVPNTLVWFGNDLRCLRGVGFAEVFSNLPSTGWKLLPLCFL